MEIANSKPHVVLLPGPGMGHLIPILELGKRLVNQSGLQVTVFVVSSGHFSPAQTQTIQSAKSSKLLDIIILPPVDLTGAIPPGASFFAQSSIIMSQAMPVLKSALSALEFRPAAFVTDQFGAVTLKVTKDLGIPAYVYSSVSAWTLATCLQLPLLDKEVVGEFKEPLKVPGCRSLPVDCFAHPLLDRNGYECRGVVRMAGDIAKADGILVNSWEDLESTTLASMRDENLLGKLTNMAPIYDIGPVISAPTGSRSHELFGWLNKQPIESVVYVCFGSVGTHTSTQTAEIAFGLEMSQQRFIWVARPPTVKIKDGTIFNEGSADDPSTYLPEGFLNRTQNWGLVVPEWAPQVEVLSHPSVGGFLSHCGWNSSVEAITNGLPVVVWPLFGEQMANAHLLVEAFGIGIRSKFWPSKGVIGREEISTMIRKMMVDKDGAKLRKRAKELQDGAKKALAEGGSSLNAMSLFVKEITVKSTINN